LKSDKNIAQQPTEKEILFLLKDFNRFLTDVSISRKLKNLYINFNNCIV